MNQSVPPLRILALILALPCSSIALSARADYHLSYINSVEWLVDNSDTILVIESQEETVKATAPEIVQVLKGSTEGVKWPLRRTPWGSHVYFGPRYDDSVRLLFIRGTSELLGEVSLVREWNSAVQHRFYGVTQTGELLMSPSTLVNAVKDRLEVRKNKSLGPRTSSAPSGTSNIAAPLYFPLETTGDTYILTVPFDSHLRDEYIRLLQNGDAAQCIYAIYGLSHFHGEVAADALRDAMKMESVLPSYRRKDGRTKLEELTVEDVRRKAEETLANLVINEPNPKE